MIGNTLGLSPSFVDQNFNFKVDKTTLVFDTDDIKARLLDLETPYYLVNENSVMGAGTLLLEGNSADACQSVSAVAYVPCFTAEDLGDPEFKKDHSLTYSYCSGAMANGIASEDMVIAMGKAGFLGSFGAGGLLPSQVENAIVNIQKALPHGPYAFNLIHSPHEPAIEQAVVDLYLAYGVHCVEAAAFINLTPSVVHYRVAGLSRDEKGRVIIQNKVIAKISRNEVATRFLEPPPEKIVNQLLKQGLISREQAQLATQVPMADDITVEADSGGHTDNRALTSLLPSVIFLRNQIQKRKNYDQWVRVGAAGGIGTPDAAFAAFAMGAAYVVTGSINQACIEAGASAHTRSLLANADMADTAMAPASDMFEMGVKLQVLKRGTFFPMRAKKLYDLYLAYNSLDDIPFQDREKIEKQIFQKDLDAVWDETRAFFEKRDPGQLEKAEKDPKKKMALVFRWYLGLASKWSNTGNSERKLDYQIWCGPCMGAFNAWVKGTYLEMAENRRVVDVAMNIMTGAAYLNRLMVLKSQKVIVPSEFSVFEPQPFFMD